MTQQTPAPKTPTRSLFRPARIARSIVTLAFIAACDSSTKPIPVASVVVSPNVATLIAGVPQQLTASTRDSKGVELTGRSVTWSSTATSTATVSSSGLVTTLAPGVATIQATSEGIVGSANITVLPVPIASITVTLPSATMLVGGTMQATAVLRDAAGGVLNGRTVTFASNAPAVASVSATGLITAIAPGSVSISAIAEGQTGGAFLTVQSPPPSVTAIAPATLVPGNNATITGSGFDTSLGGTSVTINGIVAPIVSITSTELVVAVPCVESGNVDVRVTRLGATPISRTQPLAVTRRTVPLGQALILNSSTASACNELVATGAARYLVTVFSVATSQNTTNAFEFAGNTPAAGTALLKPTVVSMETAPIAPTALSPADERLAQYERRHAEMLERNRVDFERLQARYRALPATQRQSLRAAAADVQVGDTRNSYFTFSGGCADTTRVMRLKAIRVGTKSIIWEDSANTLQSADDAVLAGFYERLGRIFDEDQYATVKKGFGDPLLRDAVTDNDGKVHMIFTQRVNGTGAAAYVTSCDQYPNSISPGSNFGQYFYGAVPITPGSNINSTNNPDGWFYFMGRTVVHEVKHIAALSARVANNAASFEASWLEEGTARHAEELWTRDYMHHVEWRANSGFGTAANNGMYCDFHPTDGTCNANDPVRRPSYGMRRQFNEIRDKLIQPWNWSPYGDATGQAGSIFYQTTWSLVRYLSDRFATSDTTFLRAITNSTNVGLSNLSAVTGASVEQMIGGWGLALYADDYPGLNNASVDIQFQTWNLRNIYAALNAAPAWTARWNTPFPIAPVALTNGSFVAQVPLIRGGAHAYFELSGNFPGTQLLNLRTNASTTLSSNLRLAITRLQ